MSDKPAPSDADLLPCFVCGEPTKTRCPACAKTGIDLFFCSREHQVLAWPTHKLVCGPRSAPFKWPVPSQAELAHLKAIAQSEDPLTGETLVDMFGKLLPQVPIERLLTDLAREPSPLPAALHAPLLVAARSFELGHYEGSAEKDKDAAAKPILPLPILRASNLAFNIYTLFARKEGLWSSNPELSPWWTPLHARLVHFTTVHHIMSTAGNDDKELLDKTEAWFVKIETDLREFLAGPVLKLKPAEVEDAVGDFLLEPTNV